MQKYSLVAKPRTLLGRKVKQLRKEGLLPGNVFGKKIKSQAISVSSKEFLKVFSGAGESVLVDLDLEGKKTPVLISNVTYHPITGVPLHIDLHQVDLKEKVTAKVPLLIIGESPAVKDKLGVMLSNLDEIEVEALPQDLPENIGVDVSGLMAVDASIKISDLKISPQVKILSDAELEVVKIAPLVSKEAVKQAEAEAQAAAAAAAGAAAETAPLEGKSEASEATAKPADAKKEEPKA